MTAVLDHTVVAASEIEATIEFYSTIMGFWYDGKFGNFEQIRINDGLILDFVSGDPEPARHFAFALDHESFDQVFARVKEAGISYGDSPHSRGNMKGPGKTMGARGSGDSVYFHDPNGHILEIRRYSPHQDT